MRRIGVFAGSSPGFQLDYRAVAEDIFGRVLAMRGVGLQVRGEHIHGDYVGDLLCARLSQRQEGAGVVDEHVQSTITIAGRLHCA